MLSGISWSFTVLLLWWWVWSGDLGFACAWLSGWNVLSHDLNLLTPHQEFF